MNCIYCHQKCEDMKGRVYRCAPCVIAYACRSTSLFGKSTLPDEIIGVFIGTNKDDYIIEIDVLSNKTKLYLDRTMILTVDKLYWVFPNNVESYIMKFRKLVPIS